MKFLLILFLFTNSVLPSKSQVFSDSLLFDMNQNINELKSQNENLKSRLELQGQSIGVISKNQNLTDQAKWELIKSNIVKGSEIYKILSDDIIDLKSQVINQDFQGYIKELSSVEKNPLGFSFDQVILKIAESKAIFKKKRKNEKFVNTLKALSISPIVGLIPYASQAVSLSSSAINVAYSAGFQDKKVPLEKVQEFEKDLKRYLGYYASLDKANLLNQNSSTQTISNLEVLQLDLLEKIRKDIQKAGIPTREQKSDELIDDYYNYLTKEFSNEIVKNSLAKTEAKYKKDNKVNLLELLNNEQDLRNINNNLDYLQDLSTKYISIYDQYFDVENKYYEQLRSSINIAKANSIIENVGDKSSDQVYQDLMKKLADKKKKKDSAIKSSINIKELKEKIDLIEVYKIL
ncbi:MAG: hypothetical protein V4683_01845 [Bacteroidota bacterium]